ncbi:hypothetical protein LSAT2_023703, partial [Lamellibrachia satsuma]
PPPSQGTAHSSSSSSPDTSDFESPPSALPLPSPFAWERDDEDDESVPPVPRHRHSHRQRSARRPHNPHSTSFQTLASSYKRTQKPQYAYRIDQHTWDRMRWSHRCVM